VGLDEETVVGGFGFFADQEFSTFLFAEFDVVVDFIELDFGDLGALVGVFVEWVSHFVRFRKFCEFLGEFIFDRFMDVNSCGRTTDLSLIVEPVVRTTKNKGGYIPLWLHLTACSISASSNTILGLLPPSSRVTFFNPAV
jgi:hypothetical protein